MSLKTFQSQTGQLREMVSLMVLSVEPFLGGSLSALMLSTTMIETGGRSWRRFESWRKELMDEWTNPKDLYIEGSRQSNNGSKIRQVDVCSVVERPV
jgi:hypothetical protein